MDNGYGEFDYILGAYDDSIETEQSHAWLEKDGLIIDITADQFSDIHSEVIITKDHTWHE